MSSEYRVDVAAVAAIIKMAAAMAAVTVAEMLQLMLLLQLRIGDSGHDCKIATYGDC